jgi:hypothetical protein
MKYRTQKPISSLETDSMKISKGKKKKGDYGREK